MATKYIAKQNGYICVFDEKTVTERCEIKQDVGVIQDRSTQFTNRSNNRHNKSHVELLFTALRGKRISQSPVNWDTLCKKYKKNLFGKCR